MQLLEESEPDYVGSSIGNRIQGERLCNGCGGKKRSLTLEYQSSTEDFQQFRGVYEASQETHKRPGMFSPTIRCPYPQRGLQRRSYPPLPYRIPPHLPPTSQKSDSCGQNSSPDAKECCPCGRCGGPACANNTDNPVREKINGECCGGSQQNPRPCKSVLQNYMSMIQIHGENLTYTRVEKFHGSLLSDLDQVWQRPDRLVWKFCSDSDLALVRIL